MHCRGWYHFLQLVRGVREDAKVTVELIDRARAGGGEAFREMIGPYERELRVHC
jgi:hypothetical protein